MVYIWVYNALMALLDYDTKMLMKKREFWYYQRRVPKRYAHVDARRFVKKALCTKSIDEAISKRDALIKADDEYWQALSLEAIENGGVTATTLAAQQHRYEAAKARAMAYGLRYNTASALAAQEEPEALYERVALLMKQSGPNKLAKREDVDAVLGGAAKPAKKKVKVSDAFKLYLDTIAFDEIKNKSPKQLYTWKKVKRTSVNYFIEVIGDVAMDEITREMAMAYRSWWIERMIPGNDQAKPAKPNTANRHIGNVRRLYEDYYTHIGDDERLNPFRKMFFKDDEEANVPAFENDWVREHILKPGMFDGLNDQLRLMIYVLIETGCRTSEICNLKPEHIRLDSNTPYIKIVPDDRELKTKKSERVIPLVGLALEAMRQAPEGFPHYRDRGELVSANLMKAFRTRNLFPTPEHVIYSFRHAFEDRMLEAGIDYAVRCYFMGHKNNRPSYGEIGSIEFRREQLEKIAHPYDPMLLIK